MKEPKVIYYPPKGWVVWGVIAMMGIAALVLFIIA